MQQDFLTKIAGGINSSTNQSFLDRVQSQIGGQNVQSQSTEINHIPDFGIPQEDFKSQVDGLFQQGTPLEQVHSAIDYHPDINDKKSAKEFATQHYDFRKNNIVAGVDISSYATDPNHEYKVAKIYKSIANATSTVSGIETTIKNLSPNSPIKAQDVQIASQTYKVDPALIIAIMHQDSTLGTKGLGAKTNNPGNVGNTDDGKVRRFRTIQEGVLAVAKTLAKHKIKA